MRAKLVGSGEARILTLAADLSDPTDKRASPGPLAANAHDGLWHSSSVWERCIAVCYLGYSDGRGGRGQGVAWLEIEYVA